MIAAIVCVLILLSALLQIGNIDINVNVSVNAKTDAPFAPRSILTSAPGVMSDAPGFGIAVNLLHIVSQAFVPSLMAFHVMRDAPKQDDSLMERRVLILLRVMLGFQLAFWILRTTGAVVQITEIAYSAATVCASCSAFSSHTMFSYSLFSLLHLLFVRLDASLSCLLSKCILWKLQSREQTS